MRVGRIVKRTWAEGPGQRFALWVQGCELGCPGCYAKLLQNPVGGTQMSIDQVLEELSAVRVGLEGVTFLGGEPFLQADELSVVAAQAQAWGLSVLTFTGYRWESLRAGTADQRKLLDYSDILLDGPYLQEERDFSRPLVGSRNQRILFLTKRYNLSDLLKYHNKIEVRIYKDGSVLLNGMGDFPGIERKLTDNKLIGGKEVRAIY